MPEKVEQEARDKMDKALAALEHNFETLRTGRASLGLLEGITVSAYGVDSPLNQVSSLSTPDARTIAIQPWDKSLISSIEKAIMAANLGITPSNDGQLIRLNIPPLTEERRKEVVKVAHKMREEAHVAVRNIRRHANDEIKKLEKSGAISEDERDDRLDKIQKMTDEHIKKADEMAEAKEAEILEL